MSKRDKWFIYGLAESASAPVRYVGVTKNMHDRLLQHLSRARSGSPYPVHKWIKGLDVPPVMVLLETGHGDGWQEAEQRWIRLTPQCLNVAEGGEKPAVSPEARRRAGDKLRSRIFTPEHRARISEAKRGKPRVDGEILAERCRMMAESNRGKKMNLSPQARAARSENGKVMGAANARKMWDGMNDEERQRRSEMASEQMKRVWAQRKGNGGGRD